MKTAAQVLEGARGEAVAWLGRDSMCRALVEGHAGSSLDVQDDQALNLWYVWALS